MALARILIDGYSLLHEWQELAPRSHRHSAAARDELIHWLTQYRDVSGSPITVFFDGAGAPAGTPPADSSPELEILFSKAGQTADDLIERVAYRLLPYGEVLVVTDDLAERETVTALGAHASSCENFIRLVQSTLGDLERELNEYNARERRRFKKPK